MRNVAARLHLDHLGAEAGEHHAGKGAGDELAHLEHAQAGQGFGRGGTARPRTVTRGPQCVQ